MIHQSIIDSMQKLCEEFSKFLKAHQDASFTMVNQNTGAMEVVKEFRLVSIQDIALNFQHAALLIDRVGEEFQEYPRLILNFMSELPRQVYVSTGNAFISRNTNDNTDLVFTKTVFLYTDAFDVDQSRVVELFAQHGLKLVMRDKAYWTEYMNSKVPDAFICHDSRDKDKFVRPLVHELAKRLVKVWYDEYSLTVGDSIVDKIDEGLRQCRFGIVIISENFLTRKKWTNREFRSLTTKELEAGKKVILPIWLGVTQEQVAQYSLDLADKLALSGEMEMQKLADKIVAEIRKSA